MKQLEGVSLMRNQLQLDGKGWGMLILLSILWGGSFLFIEIALEELAPITIVTARITMAGIASYILLKLTGGSMPRNWPIWRAFLLLAVVNNITPFMLIVWGQQYVMGGIAAILNASTPVFAVIIAQIFTDDEKLSVHKVAGLLIAIFGLSVVIGFETIFAFSLENIGQIAILAAGLSYAVGTVYGRRFGKEGIQPLTVATGQFAMGVLLMVPFLLITNPDILTQSISYRVLGALLALGIVCTSIAYMLYFRLVATVGATNTTLVTLLVPVSAMWLTWLVLGEQLPPSAFAGMAVIALGLLILDGRVLKWLKAKTAAA
ncbi:MAG: DMT family transporter [Kordiimonadaceae bacterium]|nr:DMT family transporter [Kordiimonadaceae bacterium]